MFRGRGLTADGGHSSPFRYAATRSTKGSDAGSRSRGASSVCLCWLPRLPCTGGWLS
jgi:hypothetical protein